MSVEFPPEKLVELATKVATLEAIYQNYLSWAALMVAILTLIVALASVVSFLYFRKLAKDTAFEAASEQARTVAEQVANEYIQRELPNIIGAYRGLDTQLPDAEIADKISEAQPSDGSNG